MSKRGGIRRQIEDERETADLRLLRVVERGAYGCCVLCDGVRFSIRIIPYKGAAQSILDVVRSHRFFHAYRHFGGGQLRGGTVRGWPVRRAASAPELSDVPTFRELGYDIVATNGLTSPAATALAACISCRRSTAQITSRCRGRSSAHAEDGMLVRSMDARPCAIRRGRRRAVETR